ncbi:hypothetical protein Pan44_51290 [Caulifigura coniformis]|uniref:Right handed beta helix domain-containing protein n=1 Tax=Caulifigura coniformis TaxID=2527983 RepID=A0A517SLR5_9PLAN|nr:hypothetical protein [Caulifigura coniformis]QDT57064.1 hypothetical protein Pan44_51290 [Caulifigura coniformis]
MNATWKSWLNRLMNRGTGAVRSLGFTTRRPSRMLRMPRMRAALGVAMLSGAVGTTAWGQTPGAEGVVKLGGGAASVSQAQGIVGLSDPSASMAAGPSRMAQAQYAAPAQPQYAVPAQQYVTPYNAYQNAPRLADRTLQHYEQGQGVGYAATQDVTQILYRAQHVQGEIYGANNGYTSLNAFVPLGTSGSDALWYIQPRANVTNDGRGMANLGVGYRFYTPDDNRVWSATFWWDGDGGHHSWYNQLGAHFASVGKYLTWRGGFALPIGSTTDQYGAAVGSTFFVDDNVGLNIVSQLETAYRRFDLEASMPLPYLGRYGWEAGVGTYYLHADKAENSMGVSARVEAQVTEDFLINTLVTSDEIFGGNLSVNMEFTLPDGAPSRWFRPKRVRDALTESDKRNYRVAAGTQSVTTQTLAIDPNDGNPLRIAHIDPNATAPGTGFVQSPYMSILEFESLADGIQSDYDIILVQARNDSSDTNLNTGVTLFDRQRLLGASLRADGTRHTISAILNGVAGQFELPYTPSTNAPLLTNTGNPGVDVVTLANMNEVSAFQIDGGATAAGIRGTGIDSFNLNSLSIATQNVGIDITSDTTPLLGLVNEDYGRITNVTVAGQAPATAGIQVRHQAGDLDLLVANNTVTGVVGETVDSNLNGVIDPGVGIAIVAENTGVISATDQNSLTRPTGILNNTATGNDTNLKVTALNGGDFMVNVIGNTLNSNTDTTSAGFVALADNGTLTLSTVAQNQFNSNAGDGVRMEAANGGTLFVPSSETTVDTNGNGVIDLGFVGNTMTGNAGSGVRVVADGVGSVANVSIGAGNNVSNNGQDAIVLEANDGGVINVDQLSIANATGNLGAILRVAGDGGIIDLGTISGTTFDRRVSGSAGILFDATNATISGVISGNQFLGSETNDDTSFGIGGEIRGGTLDLVIDNNLFDGNADAAIGLIFTASDDRPAPGTGTPLEGDAVEAKVVITRNTIINTFDAIDPRFAGQGIALILNGSEQDNGVPPVDPTTNVQPAAYLEGLIAENIIGVNPTGTGVDLADPDTYNVADGNDGAGIYVEVNGDTSISDLAGVGSTVDDAELNGLFIGAMTYQGEAYQGNLIANNDEGIQVRRNDSSVIDNFVINDNDIVNNLNDGIDIAANNGGIPFGPQEVLNFEITNNLLLNNGFLTDGTQGTAGRGIQLRAEASALLEVNIRENTISGNRLSGIEARTFTDTHDFIGAGRDVASPLNGGDNGAITGVWELNTITNNGFLLNEDTNRNGILDAGEDADGDGVLDVVTEGHGIALGRIDFIDPDNPGGVLEGFNNGGFLIDTDGDGTLELPILSILNNRIAGNAEDGIHVYLDKSPVPSTVAGEPRTTRISILGNDIVSNGEDGFNVQNTQGSSAIARIEFNNNLVSQNGLYSGLFQIQQAGTSNAVNIIGDGVEIVTAAGAQTILEANNNRIINNNGRGVNILTAEGSHLETFWDGNNISGNSREGFYVVNAALNVTVLGTSGAAQGTPFTGYTADSWLADFDSNHEMYSYGHIGGTNLGAGGNTPPGPIAPFFINWVNDVPGPGPVTEMRLTNNLINNNGGVAEDADGEDSYSTLGGLVVRVGTSGFEDTSLTSAPNWNLGLGGVIAEIENNQLSGNVGRDVYMDGFISTQSPATGSFGDPLIRLDLQFRNNRGGSIDVSGENFSVFYNNTNVGIPGATNVDRPNPPFTNPAILRDATRNIGDPILGELPFPGFGSSTLRIELDGSAPDAFGNNIGNNQFNLIYSGFNAFDWLTVPVGTLPDPTLPAIFP